MNIFLISFGIIEYDGRLRELIKVCEKLGNVRYICRTASEKQDMSGNMLLPEGISYFEFIKRVIWFYRSTSKKIDTLFLDNRKAIIPGRILKRMNANLKVIQDVRELYDIRSVTNLSGKIGSLIELLFNKKSDIVIAANAERSKIMKKMWSLKDDPLVFENIRKLQAVRQENNPTLDVLRSQLANNDKIKIIITSGCSSDRGTFCLLENRKKLGTNFEILIAGPCTPEEQFRLKEIESGTHAGKHPKITLLGMLNEYEMKEVVSYSQIGIVNYHKNDMNNLYCASGKVYEFVFENLPVVVTSNPPLSTLVNKYKIGVVDDNYIDGILEVSKNYDFYRTNVMNYARTISPQKNNEVLAESIIDRLSTSR